MITFRVARGDLPAAPLVSESRPTSAAAPKRSPRPTKPASPPPAAPSAAAAGGPVSVTGISVETEPAQVAITIRTNVRPTYKTMVLSGPDRLVIDIVSGTMRAPTGQRRIEVAALGVSRVRSAQFKNDPAIARTVIDMDARLDYDIAVEDDGLVVRLQRKQ